MSKTGNRKKFLVFAAFILAAIIIVMSNPFSAQASSKYKKVYLGKFRVTWYAEGGLTASGKRTKANHTIAVDPSVIKLGTKVKVGKKWYVAEDTGGAIKGKRLDIYVSSASQIPDCGVAYKKVWVKVRK